MNFTNRILVRALEIVEQGWTQGQLARDIDGVSVRPLSMNACEWCSSGACLKAAHEFGRLSEDYWVPLELVMQENIPAFNDSHTKAEVVAAFKAAIEATKEIES